MPYNGKKLGEDVTTRTVGHNTIPWQLVGMTTFMHARFLICLMLGCIVGPSLALAQSPQPEESTGRGQNQLSHASGSRHRAQMMGLNTQKILSLAFIAIFNSQNFQSEFS